MPRSEKGGVLCRPVSGSDGGGRGTETGPGGKRRRGALLNAFLRERWRVSRFPSVPSALRDLDTRQPLSTTGYYRSAISVPLADVSRYSCGAQSYKTR